LTRRFLACWTRSREHNCGFAGRGHTGPPEAAREGAKEEEEAKEAEGEAKAPRCGCEGSERGKRVTAPHRGRAREAWGVAHSS